MPSFENYPIYVSEERAGNRPKCVFDRKALTQQSFRTYDFPDMSAETIEEDVTQLRTIAAEARADFERELAQKVTEAERRGQELGVQEAAQIHKEERAKLSARIDGAVEAFHMALDRAEASSTRDALRLGLMVGERIARITLSEKPDALVSNLVDGLSKMEGDGEVKVVAAPELAEKLTQRTEEVLGELDIANITFESDEALQPGDLMIYRGSAALDARVATRLRMIERSLLNELGLEGSDGED